jgi:tagatose 1,6-diphosphate aldolase GatY/KbaY
MLVKTRDLLNQARKNRYAVGAFNVYNLEGATAVVQSATELKSPVMLQILPSALGLGGSPLVALCLEMARTAHVPVAVHLDHCQTADSIYFAINCGFSSVMADGSDLAYDDNVRFTRDIVARAQPKGCAVEAELGKLSGEEDGLSIDAREARMTSPDEAVDFVERTEIDMLAVCIGNVHGRYLSPPELDFDRLEAIAQRIDLPLVLHGTSGLPDEMISRSIESGVCKFNVNTEVRTAYVDQLRLSFSRSSKTELIGLMEASIKAMKEPIRSKLELFCSFDRAKH